MDNSLMDKHDYIHRLIKLNTLAIEAREVSKAHMKRSECAGCETIYPLITKIIEEIVNIGDELHYEDTINPRNTRRSK